MLKIKNIIKLINTRICIILILSAQVLAVALTGILAKDVWYSIVIALVGISFNMLVSLNNSYGFLVGFVYAIASGIFAYFSESYATFGFMIIMQAPMAIFSFISWRKSSMENLPALKKINSCKAIILLVSLILVGVASYYLLNWIGGSNILQDSIFFVFSVLACVLLALRYKIAYIITLFSGLGGVLLWTVNMWENGEGVSMMVFYIIVCLNSIFAIWNNYFKKKSLDFNNDDDLVDNANEFEVAE